jgi:hypothetical protein
MKFLCLDLGLYVEQCAALSNGGKNEVLYWTPWQTAFPRYQDYAIGKDFEGMKKVLYLFDHIEEADCIVNFDVHFNDLIAFLRKKYPEKSILGSGKGERLENDRWGLKKIIKELKLPLQKSTKVTGITQLREFIKKNPDQYVKINIFRQDISSFHAKDYKTSELLFDEIESAFGPFKEKFDFVCEQNIDTDVEVGVDIFTNGKEYIKPYFVGVEYSKSCYIAYVTNEFPIPLKETMDKFLPVFRNLNYRGAISSEEKIVDRKSVV